jgi:hypothetical protein
MEYLNRSAWAEADARPDLAAPSAAPEPTTALHPDQLRVTVQRTAYLAGVPASARRLVQKAFEGACSPRQAIKANCLDCSGFDRGEIRSCQVILCPLHAFRPFQSGEEHDDGE